MRKGTGFLSLLVVLGAGGGTAAAQDAVVEGSVEVGVGVQPVAQPQPTPPPGYAVQQQPAQAGVVVAPVVDIGDEPRTAMNSIYVEGLGPGLLYSINYDRLVIPELAVRIGLSYMSFSASAGTSSSSVAYMTFPLTVSYIGLSSGSHALELGAGMVLLYASGSACGVGSCSDGSGVGFMGTAIVGWRLQPRAGGFNFRLGLSLLIAQGLSFSADPASVNDVGILPWPYMSLGYSF